jgi:hypothetical protein
MTISIEDCKPGFIIWGARPEAYHPIVFLGHINAGEFLGAMISTKQHWDLNIPFQDKHFVIKDGFGIKNEPSFLVQNYLIKKEEWGPFKMDGQLTEEGLAFVNMKLAGTAPKIWMQYLAETAHLHRKRK